MNAMHVPVLDVARLDDPATLRALDRACREWGFFQVTGHGLDPRLLRGLLDAAHRFFALPAAAKERIARSADNPWGFFDRELTKNTRDWKQIFDFGPPDGPAQRPQWPAGLPGFDAAVRGYYAACAGLAARLVDAIGANLGMPAGHLEGAFGAHQSSFVRLNYYPPCPEPARPEGVNTPAQGYLGVNHHTDAGALTILLQDAQPGLEVFRDGRWHLVEPRADALVVNIGDVVQVWSNDRYPAALHRVLANTRQPRYSAPFFYCPAYDADYAPLPGTVDAAHPPRYRPINWGEFRARRAAGDYANLGEEVQLAHYAL
jgi:isopenicillin N synthase-like dioxygenase